MWGSVFLFKVVMQKCSIFFRFGEKNLGRPKIFSGEFSEIFENREKTKGKIKKKSKTANFFRLRRAKMMFSDGF